ncbi:MAG: DUF87 domain-containing protein, partial [Candidatus Sigynarchaeota archaeon]
MVDEQNIDDSYEIADQIAVIGSPSSTSELTLDVLGTAVDKKLVGNVSMFRYSQDGKDHYALGQITEVTMQNAWTQDPTMRGIIRQKGRVDPVTERQDVHTASMVVSSIFARGSKGMEPSILGTVPATGTPIKILNEDLMNGLLSEYQDQLFYLGTSYGTSVKMPMWFKHFGNHDDPAGVGEAYHIGIFGKTGSGKSVLAKMVMLGYARHPKMSIFILDPQGEFARDMKQFPEIKTLLEQKFHKEVKVYNLHNLVLTGWDLFKKILVNSGFLQSLGIYLETNRVQAANALVKALNPYPQKQAPTLIPPAAARQASTQKIKTWDAYKDIAFDRVWAALADEQVQKMIYSSTDQRTRLKNERETSDEQEYREFWRSIANLFKSEGRQNKVYIKNLVKDISANTKNIIIIDLS